MIINKILDKLNSWRDYFTLYLFESVINQTGSQQLGSGFWFVLQEELNKHDNGFYSNKK